MTPRPESWELTNYDREWLWMIAWKRGRARLIGLLQWRATALNSKCTVL